MQIRILQRKIHPLQIMNIPKNCDTINVITKLKYDYKHKFQPGITSLIQTAKKENHFYFRYNHKS